MDNRLINFRTKRKVSPLTRLKNRTVIIGEQYFNKENILRFVAPIIFVLILLPFALFLLINITYQKRIIKDVNLIPFEIKTGVAVVKYSDIVSRETDVEHIFQETLNLYSIKKISNIYIFVLNDNPNLTPSIEFIKPIFKDVPEDSITFDVLAQKIPDVCSRAINKYQINKFIDLSYNDYLPRISYVCNSEGLYVQSYLPSTLNITSGEDVFSKTLEDIWEINTKF